MKGLNASAVGSVIHQKFSRFSRPAAIGFDASRFDQHIGVDALHFEHGFYLNLFENDPELQRLLHWQLSNSGVAIANEAKIKYQVKGCRMSGDMNTSMGNIIIMCCLTVQVLRELGIRKYEIINNGDDCAVVVERRHAHRIQQAIPNTMLNYGFEIVCEPTVYRPQDLEFCQAFSVDLGHRITAIRDPKTIISKDLYSTKDCSHEGAWNAYRRAVSDCGLAMYGDVPVLGAFYMMMRRGTSKAAKRFLETGMEYLAVGETQTFTRPTDDARLAFYDAFDITPHEQILLEERYDSIVPRFEVIHHAIESPGAALWGGE
jgi:hypothetical protein